MSGAALSFFRMTLIFYIKNLDEKNRVRYNIKNNIYVREPADCRGRWFPCAFSDKMSENSEGNIFVKR